MIKVRNLGRLGNNLFQFAFGYAAARELGTDFFMDDMGWFHLFKHRKYWQLKNKLLLKIHKRKSIRELDWTDNQADPVARLSQLQNKVSYRGYFQSEQYFLKYQKEIRNIFRFRAPFEKQFQKEFSPLLAQGPTLTINVRGGDYIHLPFSLSAEYYQKSYDYLLSTGFKPKQTIIITDDQAYAEKVLPFLEHQYFIENRSIEKDFRWLTLSDALIIPNSSFSWWGAWLNTRAKQIIAPQYWLGWPQKHEDPLGIIPPSWHGIS